MVYWITGKAKAGKTKLAYKIANDLRAKGIPALILDGDDVRDRVPADFTDEGRKNHILRIAGFASIAEEQGITVIIALVSPKKEWRMEARKKFKNSALLYVPGGQLWEGTTFDEPDWEEMNL